MDAEQFISQNIRIRDKTVAKLLREHGYSLQAPNKSVEGTQHPDRDSQFEYVNAKAQERVDRNIPVISVDTKKKELVGNLLRHRQSVERFLQRQRSGVPHQTDRL